MCLLTNDFHPVAWVIPQAGVELGGAGGKNNNFLSMAMRHIILKGMISRPVYTELFYPRIRRVTLEWGQKVKYH